MYMFLNFNLVNFYTSHPRILKLNFGKGKKKLNGISVNPGVFYVLALVKACQK